MESIHNCLFRLSRFPCIISIEFPGAQYNCATMKKNQFNHRQMESESKSLLSIFNLWILFMRFHYKFRETMPMKNMHEEKYE